MDGFRDKMTAALGAVMLSAMLSSGASAATQVFEGLDNSRLVNGGPHPKADAARSAFIAAAGAVLVQTFDDLPTGAAPSVLNGPFGATLNATATNGVRVSATASAFDTYPTSGKFIDSISANGTTFYTFNFDIPTRAFGFDISDASDWIGTAGNSNLVVTLLTSGGNHDQKMFGAIAPNTMVSGNFGFFGVVSDAQDLLGFAISNPLSNPDSDGIGIDNLMVSIEPVPLPASAWLLMSAVAGAVGLARRRRPVA